MAMITMTIYCDTTGLFTEEECNQENLCEMDFPEKLVRGWYESRKEEFDADIDVEWGIGKKEHTFEKLDLAFTQEIQYVYREKLLPYENKEVIDRVVELAKECDDILHIVAGTKKKKDLELNVFVFYIEYMKDEPSDFEPTISKIQTYLDSIGPNYRSYAFFIKQVHFRYRKPIFNIYDHKNK